MTFTSCGRFLIIGSKKSNELYIYDIQFDNNNINQPIYNIMLSNYPNIIETKTNITKNILDIIIIYSNNNSNNQSYIEIYRINLDNKDNNYEMKLIQFNNQTNMNEIIINGIISYNLLLKTINKSVINNNKQLGITIVIQSHNNANKIHNKFHFYEIEDLNGEFNNETIIIDSIDNNTINSTIKRKYNEDIDIIDETTNENKTNEEIELIEKISNKKQKLSNNNSNEFDMSMDVDMNSTELTLEQRLAMNATNNNVTNDSNDTTNQSLIIHKNNNNTTNDLSNNNNDNNTLELPTSDSLVVLIEQSLQSGDNILLEQCLIIQDNAIIEETCKRLPNNRIIKFIELLINKFEKRPSRGILITNWLLLIIKYHKIYLKTINNINKILSNIIDIINIRLSNHTKLIELNIRLDNTIESISSTSTSTINQNNNNKNNKNSNFIENNNNNGIIINMKPKNIIIED